MPKIRPIALFSATLAALSFLLGIWGFAIFSPELPWQNHIYRALQLFPIDGPNESPSLPAQLEVARFLAPFSLILGIIATIFHVSQDLLQNIFLRFSNQHLIIAGLNEISAGFVIDALDKKQKVIVIDQDSDNPWNHDLRARGAICLHGDLTADLLLKQARIQKASRFFAFSEKDTRNVEAILKVSEILEDESPRSSTLRCYTRFQDTTFQQAFREHSLLNKTSDRMDAALVNLDNLAARLTFEKWPLEIDDHDTIHDDLNLVIFGDSPLGMALLHHAFQIGHYRSRKKLTVTLVSNHPTKLRQKLSQHFHQFDDIAKVYIISTENQTSSSCLAALKKENPAPDAWHTLICAGDCDEENFALAQHLKSHAAKIPGRIFCALPATPGLVPLLNTMTSGRQIHPLPSPADLATWDSIVNEPHEARARMIHRNYRESETRAGKSTQDNSSLVDWEAMPEAMREQNRLQADHLPIKLRAIGVDIDNLPDQETLTRLLTDKLELLAEVEHLRWNAVQFLAGWTYAPGDKNPELLTHPCLVSWTELTDEIQQYDRDAVLNIPNLLYATKHSQA